MLDNGASSTICGIVTVPTQMSFSQQVVSSPQHLRSLLDCALHGTRRMMTHSSLALAQAGSEIGTFRKAPLLYRYVTPARQFDS